MEIADTAACAAVPSWVPDPARAYIDHTSGGRSIRQLARDRSVHASTILRQVRKTETQREDPLIDAALRKLAQGLDGSALGRVSEAELTAHGERILRRMIEPGAVLAVARDMDMGVVVREAADGEPQRTAVVERDIAEAMALREWIAAQDPAARVLRYHITPAGRSMLRQLLYAGLVAQERKDEFSEEQADFEGAEPGDADALLRHARSALAESPLAALARRKGKDGAPFLTREQVAAGERLREDFELAQAGRRDASAWEAFLKGGPMPDPLVTDTRCRAAQARVTAALEDLGPGLADVVLRACCLLEGMEQLEGRLGWSARSGKIVLRIALDRLRRHFDDKGGATPLIG